MGSKKARSLGTRVLRVELERSMTTKAREFSNYLVGTLFFTMDTP